MYANLPEDVREQHPYHMYDEIRLQPGSTARALAAAAEYVPPVAAALRQARRIVFTGCGTSYHSALGGAWLLRAFSRGLLTVDALPALDAAYYAPGLGPGDVVLGVSHSGGTAMTIRALERARAAGATTVAITGFPQSDIAVTANHLLPTGYEDERSWAHTASYTATLTVLAELANQTGHADERLDLSALPEVIAEALELEGAIHRLAAGAVQTDEAGALRLVLAGGGPNAPTAREGVLKIQETSYLPAIAYELEEILHGPLASFTPETLLLVLVPTGACTARAADLTRAAERLGLTPALLLGNESDERFAAAHRLLLPDVPERLSPLPYVIPLQLFSYFLAVGKGLNPDLIHRDDARYRAARAAYD